MTGLRQCASRKRDMLTSRERPSRANAIASRLFFRRRTNQSHSVKREGRSRLRYIIWPSGGFLRRPPSGSPRRLSKREARRRPEERMGGAAYPVFLTFRGDASADIDASPPSAPDLLERCS